MCVRILRKASVRTEQLASHWKDFHKIWYLNIHIFLNLSRKVKFHQYLTRITCTLHQDQYTFMIISRSFLLGMRNVSDKIYTKLKHFMFNNSFFFENRDIYGVMWTNTVQSDIPQMTIWGVRIAYWIPKATNTSLEYVKLIDFP